MPATQSAPQITLQQHLSYICSRLLAYMLPVLLFLVTTSFYLKTYDSAQIKITFTQVGSMALVGVWLLKMFVDGKLPFDRSDLWYVAPFLAFLASGLVSWAHSPFRDWALEETLRRVFYMVIALVAIAEIRSSERRTRLWRWLMAAALVAIGYGLVQYLDSRFFPQNQAGLDPFIWRQAFSKRVFSTFGNPNFYGNFLVIITPLILAAVLRDRGPLGRPFILLVITATLVFLVDKMQLGLFGGFDPSYGILFGGLIVALLALFLFYSFWGTSKAGSLPLFLILFSLLFLNLYATETKGAWVGFTAALAVTVWLIFEYFLHFEEHLVEAKSYVPFVMTMAGLFIALLGAMFVAFVLPLLRHSVEQIGFQILRIPTLIAGVIAAITVFLLWKKPWNLKKMIYGVLVFFILAMGAIVLQFSKTRLTSVSFRLFTWISTWEMIRTEPLLGHGIGTFKVIYPAYRRPHIIVLEGRSNTETDHSEDEYLETWQDEGLIGFGIFLWMVGFAVVMGFKQLRWYSKLSHPDSRRRKITDIEGDPRSYETLGYLGAYIGALIHWAFDVSIRFVSSGVYSGLLPGMLVGMARNQARSAHSEPLLSYDRWIRFAVAAFWTGVLLWLRVELVPQSLIVGGDTTEAQIITWAILAGLLLWAIMEIVEIGNTPPQESSFEVEYPARTGALFPARFAAGLLCLGGAVFGMSMFGQHFQADVFHNMGIFFSKEAIWSKSPIYDTKVTGYPPDIRKRYQETGGALEHYAGVVKRNPYFPMAYYFTGNVYNDWGSQEMNDALQAKAKGDMDEAKRLQEKADDLWNRSESAYESTKKLAPNYVQTHHQMGLLYLKRAEAARAWGDNDQANKFYAVALKNFMLYHMLDPVFPPNYDRIAQILLMEGKTQDAIALFKEGLYYNDVIARSIHKEPFGDRAAGFATSLAKMYFSLAQQESKDPFHPPNGNVKQAIDYFKQATGFQPTNVEAWKGLAFLYSKTGQPELAADAFAHVQKLAPNDAGLNMKPIAVRPEE